MNPLVILDFRFISAFLQYVMSSEFPKRLQVSYEISTSSVFLNLMYR